MIRSILVPLDGSTFGEHALPLAASLARRSGAALHLAHVHDFVAVEAVSGVAVMDSIDRHLREDERAYLADVSKRLGEAGPTAAATALLDGEVVPALRDYASRHSADLVVMSTHGRGALGRFWLGGVADQLMRDLRLPTLLVRPHEGKPDLGRLPELRSILVPLDGTPLAEQALEPALALVGLFGAELKLLRVIKPVVRPSYLPEGGTILGLTHGELEQVRELQRKAGEESRKYLSGVAARVAGQGVSVRTRVVIDEEPAAGILLEARAGHADLIAIQTHGRSGLSRLFLGSVADKVVRGAEAPVLLNRPAG